MQDRRDFLRTTIGGALIAGISPLLNEGGACPAVGSPAVAPLDILVLGGTENQEVERPLQDLG